MPESSFSKRLSRETQQRLDKEFLKGKPRGVSSNEYLSRGSTSRWQAGKYRKAAEAQENREHRAYRKDNPAVRSGDSPIEGTREEYVRRNQVAMKTRDAGRKSKPRSSGRR